MFKTQFTFSHTFFPKDSHHPNMPTPKIITIILSLQTKLAKPTSFFGLRLWLVLFLIIPTLYFVFFFLWFFSHSRDEKPRKNLHIQVQNPINGNGGCTNSSLDKRMLSSNNNVSDIEMSKPEYDVMMPNQWSRYNGKNTDLESVPKRSSSAMVMRKGDRFFTLREIEMATKNFDDGNVIGSGCYGIVYHGFLVDSTRIAVKKLWSYCINGEAKDFKLQMETIMQVRHKSLVELIGYCIDQSYRVLVYEFIDNGNLHQWLHGNMSPPLTWSVRMKIILGIAKGLAYLHEDVEPKCVHLNINSKNILLDRIWNPKISDFGLAKLFEPGYPLTADVKTTSRSTPENVSTDILPEKSDVYSFGILIMEIVLGRKPIDNDRPQQEVHLIDWIKSMIVEQKIDEVVDPKLIEKPILKELKRILLIAFRCTDPAVIHRPNMGDVIHMLEPRDLLLSGEQVVRRECDYSTSH